MRNFPEEAIAELKLEISNAVRIKEIALCRRPENNIQYLVVNTDGSQKLIPIEVQEIDVEPNDTNDRTSHQFIQLQNK